jgi:hypothetical protein
MKTVSVRFPNDSFHSDILFNLDEFKPEKEFDDEIFGWYNSTYIALQKKSLNESDLTKVVSKLK